MAGVIYLCPQCRHSLGASFFGITSGLGQAQWRCSHCGHVINSGRREWPEMGFGSRLRFVVMSLVYAGIFGLLYGLMGQQAYRNLTARMTGERPAHSPVLFFGAIAGVAVLTLAIQVLRIALSSRRWQRNDPEPASAGFFSPLSNGLTLALFPFLALVILMAATR